MSAKTEGEWSASGRSKSSNQAYLRARVIIMGMLRITHPLSTNNRHLIHRAMVVVKNERIRRQRLDLNADETPSWP